MHLQLEDIEAVVAQLEADQDVRRAKLLRLIAAYARIVDVREPKRFARQALEYRDEAGQFDDSYPPSVLYCNFSGPALLEFSEPETEQVPTETGFYHSWKLVTKSPGLLVDARGALWRCEEHGTGRVGCFAAYPGDCSVEVVVEYHRQRPEELPLATLEEIEAWLRAVAFPAVREAA